MDSLSTDADGRIRNTVANIQVENRVAVQFNRFQSAQRKGLLKWVLDGVLKILGANELYFGHHLRAETVHKQATRRLLVRLGVEDNEITPDSWLDTLGAANSVKVQVMSRFASAVLGGSSLKDFRANLASQFIGELGLLEKHWNTHTSNLMLGVDREVQLYYADSLQLNFALYGGTEKDNTRNFCLRRYGRVYSRDFINAWNSLNWKGKIDGATVESTLGGHNCRHFFSWMSEDAANFIIKRTGKALNTYND